MSPSMASRRISRARDLFGDNRNITADNDDSNGYVESESAADINSDDDGDDVDAASLLRKNRYRRWSMATCG